MGAVPMSALSKLAVLSLTVVIVGIGATFINASPVYAGDPEDIIGPVNLDKLECVERRQDGDSSKEPFKQVDIDQEREEIKRKSTGDLVQDARDLEEACIDKGVDSFLRGMAYTQIEGVVYEFHPVDPENPAESEWFAVPSRDVPVIAEGVTFEIFWGSEPDGSFYFYKTRFGEGPVMLNLKLPEDVHPLNPNILIESSGLDETWTVFLGFYRGDVGPPDVTALRLPDGNLLPLGNNTYESIVGLDGKSALPGVGGVLPQQSSPWVMGLAAIVLAVLPSAGMYTLRRARLTTDVDS
jgi:hypothetical protein